MKDALLYRYLKGVEATLCSNANNRSTGANPTTSISMLDTSLPPPTRVTFSQHDDQVIDHAILMTAGKITKVIDTYKELKKQKAMAALQAELQEINQQVQMNNMTNEMYSTIMPQPEGQNELQLKLQEQIGTYTERDQLFWSNFITRHISQIEYSKDKELQQMVDTAKSVFKKNLQLAAKVSLLKRLKEQPSIRK